jgi:hypothetical protein
LQIKKLIIKEQTVQLVGLKPTLIAPSACTEMQNFLSGFCKKIFIKDMYKTYIKVRKTM